MNHFPRKPIMHTRHETDNKVPCDPTGNRRLDSRVESVKWATGYSRAEDRTLYRKYATGPNPKSTMLKMCTWNVRGLNKVGKLALLESVLKDVAIIGISETHWKTNGHFTSLNGNLVICSSNEHASINGVGIIINKAIKDTLLGYETINDRIITVKLKATPININIIQVYAPTSLSTEEEINTFYRKLAEVLEKIPNRELLLLMGDFNAKIGSTNNDHELRTTVGKYGMGERNERGELLLDFCLENNLFVANTNFQHHARRLYTWQSPDGQTRNQIDFIMTRGRWKTSIRDVKAYPGMDCGSDHNALIAEISLKLRKLPKNNNGTRNWHLIQNDKYKEQVNQALNNITKQEIERYTAEELWETLKTTLQTEAENFRSPDSHNPKKPWISYQTWKLIKERQEVKSQGIRQPDKLAAYNELTRNINRALRSDKDKFISDICGEVEQHANKNETKDLFKKVNTLSRTFQTRYLPVKDDRGQILTDKSDIVERWRQYCKKLMESNDYQHTNTLANIETKEPPILHSEIEAAIQKLKNNKSPGVDNIVAEILKNVGDSGTAILHQICNKVWTTGEWPKNWTESIYIPLHKKGNKEDCNNYRTISLISHASKIMLYIIHERLKPFLLPQIPQEQAGFVPGRGTRNQLINVRQMIEKFYEFNVPAIFCFLDYSKAFDTVKWTLLWQILQEMGAPEHLVLLIKNLYLSNSAYVRIDDMLSESFQVGKGVRQGCILSPILFNIYGEWVIRKATQDWKGGVSIGGKKISNLRYADDTTIVANNEEEMAILLQRIEEFSAEAGLKLNRAKCKLLVVDRESVFPQRFSLIRDIERTDEFIYLGALISNKGGSEKEIKRRTGMAKAAVARLTKIWRDHQIKKDTKKRLMQTLVFPIATYGSESWTLNAACRRKIEAFEMTCYRRMLRIPWTAHKTNASILRELKIGESERLLPTIQRRILKFFGHVIRRDGIEKLVVQGKVDGKRKRGRSPIRFIDQVKSLTNMSVAQIMRTVEDRETWRTLTTP